MFVVLLEGFCLKRMMELLTKAYLVEVSPHKIGKKKGENAILLTYKPVSLICGKVLLTYIVAL